MGTRTRVPCEVPESTKLGYQCPVPQSRGCVHVRCGLRDRSSMCEASGGGVGIYVEMNSVCTNSGGTAPGVGRPRVGMNLISSLPCTSTRTVPVVNGGDVWVVGNGDVEIRSNESASHHLCNHLPHHLHFGATR